MKRYLVQKNGGNHGSALHDEEKSVFITDRAIIPSLNSEYFLLKDGVQVLILQAHEDFVPAAESAAGSIPPFVYRLELENKG